ncbi:MAG: phospholipase D family protein [Enterobacter asburiae]|jgi:hypothetical protein|nr:phospholipase D family protein [Enterobacter asburiae]
MEIQKVNSELAVVRLATLSNKNQMPKLLFATVTLLTSERQPPPEMKNALSYTINNTLKVYFKRIVMEKDAAIKWYESLSYGKALTPVPVNSALQSNEDNQPIAVSVLYDEQKWPNLSLPIGDGLFSRPSNNLHPAPFMGNLSGRLHRKFGSLDAPESFLTNNGAVKFVTQHMHVNLSEYQEYLGSAAFVSPDPLLRYIQSFMIPAQNGRAERIIYRFIPRPGQTVEGVEVFTFDTDTNLLSDFKKYCLKEDGLLDLEKGICDGQYGFIARHPDYGVLAYSPPTGFLRRVGIKVGVASGQRRIVDAPSDDGNNAARINYPAAEHIEYTESMIGDNPTEPEEFRMKRRSYYRRRLLKQEAAQFKQHWFEKGSRDEAIRFFQELMRQAQRKVIIADPYFKDIQLAQYLYAVRPHSVSVDILITNRAFDVTKDEDKSFKIRRFREGMEKLKEMQHVEVKAYCLPKKSLHDRFIVIDDNVWFSGNSLNSVGLQSSMVVRLPEPASVIKKLESLYAGIPPILPFSKEERASSGEGDSND